MKDKAIAIAGIMTILLMFLIVGNMDYKMLQKEEAWQNSVQAVEMDQRRIEEDILALQYQFERVEDILLSQGIWLYDIRNRMHFEWMDELDWEMNQE